MSLNCTSVRCCYNKLAAWLHAISPGIVFVYELWLILVLVTVVVPLLQPLKENTESWCRLCFGRYQHARIEEGDHASTLDAATPSGAANSERGTPPLLSILAHMDQVSILFCLQKYFHLSARVVLFEHLA